MFIILITLSFLLTGCHLDPWNGNFPATHSAYNVFSVGNYSVEISHQITISPQGGVSPYTFQIKSGSGSINASGIFTAPSSTETDSVLVTDNTGNQVTALVNVVDAATQIVFLSQPPSSVYGDTTTFSVVLAAEDSNGNIDPSFSGTVTFNYSQDPGCSLNEGTMTGSGTFSGGMSTVSNLQFPLSGSGTYDIQAQAGELVGCSSAVTVYAELALISTSGNSIAVNGTATLEGSGGASPYEVTVISGNGTLSVQGNNLWTFTAPSSPETDIIQIKDSTGTTRTLTLSIQVSLTQIVSTDYFNCGITSEKNVVCWGDGIGTGQGNETNQSTPIKVLGVGGSGYLQNITALTAGGSSVCAIDSSENAYCWGGNNYGQIGTGSANTIPSLTPVQISISDVTSIAIGDTSACVTSNNNVYCWGTNGSGQLGNGTTTNSYTGVSVNFENYFDDATDESTFYPTSVAVGTNHACATDGYTAVMCWGDNTYGQLGNNSTSSSIAVMASLFPILSNTVLIANGNTTCLINAALISCWGENANGQLGNNSTSGYNIPTSTYADAISSFSLGPDHSCLVDSILNEVYCSGSNNSGQLGTGTATNELSFTRNSAPNPSQVSSGIGGGCELNTQGMPYCWGDNSYGQIGNGTTSETPVLIPTAVSQIPE